MLFYKVIKVVLMDICQRSSSSEIRIITLFYSEIIPLYRKHGIFSGILCYFQLFTSNTLGRKYPQAAQETRKNKKAETLCSSHNVPTFALGSTYFQKSTHEVKVGHTLRHQGLKLTTFSWLPFPQILHSGASCLIVVWPV